ncbi:MAG: LLM class flavin-dependent oxidoreductase [Dehalococcoidia bacterium]|nr:LLM class flavin-dependent oxidoreductase [Dehalococcoidia bacterium]
MFFMHFTEKPWQDDRTERVGQNDFDLELSNGFYDPVLGNKLYNRYIDEDIFCEEMGFDGLMLNEHHSTPGCMQGVTNVGLSILARVTKKIKLIPLGNILPAWDDPMWLAEQLAMIDVISGGRLVSGWVRGTGREHVVHNTHPPSNWERFQEAHDLIIKTWTTPGPFRWEGKHFQYRYVNPWVVPYQKPHPPIWIPGTASRATVDWAAKNGFPYIILGAELEATKSTFAYYHTAAAEYGFKTGTQHNGELIKVHCEATEEKADEVGRKFLGGVRNPFLLGNEGRVKSWVQALPGLSPRKAAERIETGIGPVGRGGPAGGAQSASYEEQSAKYLIISGTPKTVITRVKHVMEQTRPGTLLLWDGEGAMNHEDHMRSLKLLGTEVLPALRDYAKELGIVGPFDTNPVAGMTRGLVPEAVTAR